MKLWMKYLAGIAAGIILGLFVLTPGNEETFLFAGETIINVGRYIFIPLMFFSIAVAVCQLRRMKKLLSTSITTIVYSLIVCTLLVAIGVLVATMFSPDRIPMANRQELEFARPTFQELIRGVFPPNLFSIANSSKNLVLPFTLLGALLGFHLFFDKEQAEPVYNFFDSMSRIFYRINKFFIEIMPLLIIIPTMIATYQFKIGLQANYYLEIVIILFATTLLTLFFIFPLLFRFFTKESSPFKPILSMTAPLLSAFITGDLFFNYGNVIRHIRENCGIPREMSATTIPLLTLFSRAGTAMVSSIAMLLIIRSYTSLEITFFQTIWVFFFSILFSYTIPATPVLGIMAIVSMLCFQYGRGLTDGYTLLIPILPFLSGIAALLDTMTVTFIAITVAKRENLYDEIDSQELI